jgi:hypothetical protein
MQRHWVALRCKLACRCHCQTRSLHVRRCYGVLRADFAVPARWKPNSTPLHIAAARGSTTMVKHMLQAYVSEPRTSIVGQIARCMEEAALK